MVDIFHYINEGFFVGNVSVIGETAGENMARVTVALAIVFSVLAVYSKDKILGGVLKVVKAGFFIGWPDNFQ